MNASQRYAGSRNEKLATSRHPRRGRASVHSHWAYAWIPLLTALVWFATVLTLLVKWLAQGRPHYVSMSPGQTVAYISDVGADVLKPLFVTGSALTAVGFVLSLVLERWARHAGWLLPNTRTSQKVMSVLAIIFAFLGGAGLILLSIFDTKRHMRLHRLFLLIFVVGVALSAIFSVVEYYLIQKSLREHTRSSHTTEVAASHRATTRHHTLYVMKLLFTVVLIALAIAFGVLLINGSHQNIAAIIEWIIAFGFTFYLLTFFGDLREGKLGRANNARVI